MICILNSGNNICIVGHSSSKKVPGSCLHHDISYCGLSFLLFSLVHRLILEMYTELTAVLASSPCPSHLQSYVICHATGCDHCSLLSNFLELGIFSY